MDETIGAEGATELVLDRPDVPGGHPEDGVTGLGEDDQATAPIGGIDATLDISATLQVGDQLAHRLLCHARGLGEGGDARTRGVEVAEDRVVGGAQVAV